MELSRSRPAGRAWRASKSTQAAVLAQSMCDTNQTIRQMRQRISRSTIPAPPPHHKTAPTSLGTNQLAGRTSEPGWPALHNRKNFAERLVFLKKGTREKRCQRRARELRSPVAEGVVNSRVMSNQSVVNTRILLTAALAGVMVLPPAQAQSTPDDK